MSPATPSATPNSRIVEFAELAVPKSSSLIPSSTAVALGAKVSPIPTPAITRPGTNEEYDDAGLRDHGQPDQRAGLEHQTGHQQRAQAGPRGEQPGDRRDHHRRRGPRQRAQAGLERAE